MNYENINTGELKTYQEIRATYPSISLPQDGTALIYGEWRLISDSPQPTYDKYTQSVREIAPVNYTQTWEIYPLEQSEITSNIEEAQDSKAAECDSYAQGLIDAAYAEPTQGSTVNSDRNKRRTESRRKDLSDKMAGEFTLTQAEKDQSKVDQKLSEYEVKVYDDSDKAVINMLKLNTAIEIYAFDISAESWNVWTPPV